MRAVCPDKPSPRFLHAPSAQSEPGADAAEEAKIRSDESSPSAPSPCPPMRREMQAGTVDRAPVLPFDLMACHGSAMGRWSRNADEWSVAAADHGARSSSVP
jgi:hypothetical protein